jgi:hypothetical protein
MTDTHIVSLIPSATEIVCAFGCVILAPAAVESARAGLSDVG